MSFEKIKFKVKNNGNGFSLKTGGNSFTIMSAREIISSK